LSSSRCLVWRNEGGEERRRSREGGGGRGKKRRGEEREDYVLSPTRAMTWTFFSVFSIKFREISNIFSRETGMLLKPMTTIGLPSNLVIIGLHPPPYSPLSTLHSTLSLLPLRDPKTSETHLRQTEESSETDRVSSEI
jgi:hypothetical protein